MLAFFESPTIYFFLVMSNGEETDRGSDRWDVSSYWNLCFALNAVCQIGKKRREILCEKRAFIVSDEWNAFTADYGRRNLS